MSPTGSGLSYFRKGAHRERSGSSLLRELQLALLHGNVISVYTAVVKIISATFYHAQHGMCMHVLGL